MFHFRKALKAGKKAVETIVSAPDRIRQEIASQVVPASAYEFHDDDEDNPCNLAANKALFQEAIDECENLTLEWLELPNIDGDKLTAALVKQIPVGEPAEQRWIIHLCGNGEFAQSKYEEMIGDAQRLHVNVACINYRHVASEGKLKEYGHLVTDTDAIVGHLVNAGGVSIENILLKGQSLGGAVATLLAYDLHMRKQHINIANMRSFLDIRDTVPVNEGHWLISSAKKLGLSLDWDMSITDAWDAISPKYKFFISAKDDGMIGDPSAEKNTSLYAREWKKLMVDKDYYEKEILTANNPGVKTAYQTELNGVLLKLDELERCHLFGSGDDSEIDTHNAPLNELYNSRGETAQEHFDTFARRVLRLAPVATLHADDQVTATSSSSNHCYYPRS